MILRFSSSGHSDGLSESLCEGSSKTISCNWPRTIDVTNAFYGRSSFWTCCCSLANCQSSTATSITESRCDKKSSCSLSASNSIYGDPCGGSSKYLTVDYNCISKLFDLFLCLLYTPSQPKTQI